MTKFKLFVAAIAISTAFVAPALAQSQEPWQSQEPGQFEAEYPHGDRAVAMAFVPSMTKSPWHHVRHAVRHDRARFMRTSA
jgi:hypothetical protein